MNTFRTRGEENEEKVIPWRIAWEMQIEKWVNDHREIK